ncbi:TIGR01777 family oxidoreductase [Corallincola platygyrae]|uniref:TIGR01777 family oxidoreductase n=1 Tax=Corallincola platygyrae TaxID=1193278 RepID=A0ABW4XJT0_9GAMM
MDILITGGTGFIGSTLVKHLKNQHKLTVLSRRPKSAQQSLGFDLTVIDTLSNFKDLDGFDAVINLAGEPIADKRWSNYQKEKITKSRWDITQQLVNLMHQGKSPPATFISGSAIGIYGRQGDTQVDESFTDFHPEFSNSVCERWEQIALSAPQSTRTCLIRTGIVLGKKGGALKKMVPPFRFGLGGPIAAGEQYMSWIHIDDMVKAIIFLLEQPTANGVYNLTAPNPVTNQEFTEHLSAVLDRPAPFRMPEFVLRILFGEMADLLIYGQRVMPTRLLAHDFHFCHPKLKEALSSIL